MKRYIDADVLIKTLYSRSDDEGFICCTAPDMETLINSMPTADVRENVRGEWEEIEVIPEAHDIAGVKTWASKLRCDQCQFIHTAIEGHMGQYNFCTNCGAAMRERS